MNPFDDQIANLTAEFEKAKRDFKTAQTSVQETYGEARSKNRIVSAKVDARGDITELRFHTTGYKSMSPPELSKLILDTIKEARGSVMTQVQDVMKDFMPPGMSDPMSGNFDFDSIFPSGERLDPEELLNKMLGSFGMNAPDRPSRAALEAEPPARKDAEGGWTGDRTATRQAPKLHAKPENEPQAEVKPAKMPKNKAPKSD